MNLDITEQQKKSSVVRLSEAQGGRATLIGAVRVRLGNAEEEKEMKLTREKTSSPV